MSKTQPVKDILSDLLVSFPKAHSFQDRSMLLVYTVADPGFAPVRGQGIRGPLRAKRVPRKKRKREAGVPRSKDNRPLELGIPLNQESIVLLWIP